MKTDMLVLGLLGATAIRATESFRPKEQQLFDASLMRQLLPPLARVFLLPGLRHLVLGVMSAAEVGGLGMILCRTRYINDALRDALEAGALQTVNMGAGLDVRALTIPETSGVRSFELDQPSAMAWKSYRLEKLFGKVPAHLSLIPIDFNTQSLEEALENAGFQRGIKTFFIWEGVTQYISAQAVEGTLEMISHTTAPGSQIAFTFIDKAIVDGTNVSPSDAYVMRRAANGGMPWVYGIEIANIETYLARFGLGLLDLCGAECYRQRFLEPLGRGMTVYAGETMVLAEVRP
jgi:methyltransferase (TIGR00027 family)